MKKVSKVKHISRKSLFELEEIISKYKTLLEGQING